MSDNPHRSATRSIRSGRLFFTLPTSGDTSQISRAPVGLHHLRGFFGRRAHPVLELRLLQDQRHSVVLGGAGRRVRRHDREAGDLRLSNGISDVIDAGEGERLGLVRLDLLSARRQDRSKDCSASSSNPMMEGPWCRFRREARARERHRHCAGG
jgi:hypothetical protein